jgi:pilus assembly protein CpaE
MAAPLIRTLIAVDPAIDQKVLSAALDDPGIEIVGVLEGHGEMALRRDEKVDAILVACNGHAEVALAYVAEAAREHPKWPVVVLATGETQGLVREAFDAGADDILVMRTGGETAAETFFALQKAVARRSGAQAHEPGDSPLICVLGPKGGAGKTLTSANLACALADAGHSVVAVDLDLQFGDLGLALGVTPEKTIYELATSGGTLDAEKLEAFLTPHASGLRVLVAPVRPDHAAAVTTDFLRELYPVLHKVADYVVVDTPPGFTPEVLATIDAASSLVMVGMLDAPSMKNAKLGLETLSLMGVPREKVRFVLNRADSNVGISHADAVSIIGRGPDALIPSSRDVVRSVNLGEPIVLSQKRSEAAKSFRALADLFVDAPAPARSPAKPASGGRRLLRRS